MFSLLVAYEMTWDDKAFGTALRLDFRPMTPQEMAATPAACREAMTAEHEQDRD